MVLRIPRLTISLKGKEQIFWFLYVAKWCIDIRDVSVFVCVKEEEKENRLTNWSKKKIKERRLIIHSSQNFILRLQTMQTISQQESPLGTIKKHTWYKYICYSCAHYRRNREPYWFLENLEITKISTR